MLVVGGIFLAILVAITIIAFILNRKRISLQYGGLTVYVYSNFSKHYIEVNGQRIAEDHTMVTSYSNGIVLEGEYDQVKVKANIAISFFGKRVVVFIDGKKVY